MQSIAYIPASNGAATPSLMTVQNVRSAGASSIITNTVAGAPAKFFATMGTPHTFTDPITGEVITVISEATAVDFAGSLLSGHVEIDAIAPGYTDLGSKVGDIVIIRPTTQWGDNLKNILGAGALNDNGTLAPTALDSFYRPAEVTASPFVASGGIIAQTTLLSASFSDIVFYINSLRYTKTGVAVRAYTASKDTYVDIDTTGTLTYTEVANNAASPTMVAGRIRLARVVTNGTAVALVDQYTIDSLGNFIYPAANGTSRSFQLGSNSLWRVFEQGNTRKYAVNKTTAIGSVASNATVGLTNITSPFTPLISNTSYSVTSHFRGGFADQTMISSYVTDLGGTNGLGAYLKNTYSGGALTFGNITAYYEFTFANGVTAF